MTPSLSQSQLLPEFSKVAQAQIAAATAAATVRSSAELRALFAQTRTGTSNDIDPSLFFAPIIEWAVAVYDAYAAEVLEVHSADPATIQDVLHFPLTTHLHDLLLPYHMPPKDDNRSYGWAAILLSNAWSSCGRIAPVSHEAVVAMIGRLDDTSDRPGRELWLLMFARFLQREEYWMAEALRRLAEELETKRSGFTQICNAEPFAWTQRINAFIEKNSSEEDRISRSDIDKVAGYNSPRTRQHLEAGRGTVASKQNFNRVLAMTREAFLKVLSAG